MNRTIIAHKAIEDPKYFEGLKDATEYFSEKWDVDSLKETIEEVEEFKIKSKEEDESE